MVSANVRNSIVGMGSVESRDGGVDVWLIQEVPVLKEGQAVKMEGYDSVEGIGGFLEGGQGAVVATMIHKRWEGKWKVVMRQRCRIGICLELGKGRLLEIWNVYVGHGKHRRFE